MEITIRIAGGSGTHRKGLRARIHELVMNEHNIKETIRQEIGSDESYLYLQMEPK